MWQKIKICINTNITWLRSYTTIEDKYVWAYDNSLNVVSKSQMYNPVRDG